MEELEIITLDDGRDYIITDEFLIDGVKYVYLTLERDIVTFCIRKINIIHESLQPIPKELDDLAKSLKSTAESEYKKNLAKEEKQ